MPNLLAHFGAQGISTRLLWRGAPAQWLLAGCLIPDLPWILQRLVVASGQEIDRYDLRLYVLVQASLAACLLLCGASALLSAAPGPVFALLGLSALTHLLLDACQTRWGHGVHPLAPLSWETVDFGLFWPGSPPANFLTLAGLGFVAWLWRRRVPTRELLARPDAGRIGGALLLVAAYLALPLLLLGGPERADIDYVRTLRDTDSRPGRALEMERCAYVARDGSGLLRTFAGEALEVRGPRPPTSGTVSVKATFVDAETIRIDRWHLHPPFWRDAASYAGLGILALFWIVPVRRPKGS